MSSSSRYREFASLAKGGMGEVSLGVRMEGAYQRVVAIKRLRGDLDEDTDTKNMFVDEARIAGMIQHPNVVSVIDFGEDDQGLFLVMEYVDGVSISAMLKNLARRKARMPIQVALRIVADAARGLQAAHELVGLDGEHAAVVHRDVSPGNLIVAFDGSTRVTDFGIARATGRTTRTSTGVLKGKVGYMAPEILRFKLPTPKTDLYSLGVVLFEMLASRRLYSTRAGVEAAANKILHEDAPDIVAEREDVPAAVVELLFELMAKEPEARPGSAGEVATRLDTAAHELALVEGIQNVSDYMSEEFDTEKVENTALLRLAKKAREQADDAVPAPTSGPLSPLTPPPQRASWRVPLLASLATLLLTLGVVSILGGDDEPTSVSESPPAEPVPSPVATPTLTTPAATLIEPVKLDDEVPEPVMSAEPVVTMRRRPRRTMRAATMTAMNTMSETMSAGRMTRVDWEWGQ